MNEPGRKGPMESAGRISHVYKYYVETLIELWFLSSLMIGC
jgi:hypothetical protein